MKTSWYLYILTCSLHVQCYANQVDFIGAALWSIGPKSSRSVSGCKSRGTLTLILFMSTQRAAQGFFLVRPVQTEGWCGCVFEGAGQHWLWGRERERDWQVSIKALKNGAGIKGVPREGRVTELQPFPSAPQRYVETMHLRHWAKENGKCWVKWSYGRWGEGFHLVPAVTHKRTHIIIL